MPERTLRQIVDELQQRLERSPDLDGESERALREVASEIQEALDREADEGLEGSLGERLSEALTRFEGAHPKLTETVKRLVDALADLGI